MTSVHKILLVENRKSASEQLTPFLESEYHVVHVRTRREALAKMKITLPEVIILDVPSLRFSCHRFCDTLQDDKLDIPLLILLANEEDFEHDISTKTILRYPFSPQQLINRVAWLLPVPDGEILQANDFTFNVKRHAVIRGDRESHLTPKQARLLEIFMRHPGEVLARTFLMRQVWDTDYTDDTRTLDVHIHWVRKAIEKDTSSPTYLHTVRGVGYRFEEAQTKESPLTQEELS